MIRTSIFPFEIEFGCINIDSDVSDFKLFVPDEWTKKCHHAIFVKNFNDGSVKIIPVACEEVAIVRMKSRDMPSLQLALQNISKRLGFDALYSNGTCVELDCFTEFVVKKDRDLIDKFIELAKTEVNVEAQLVIIFLDQKFQRLKELMLETGTVMWVKKFLNLELKREEILKRLEGISDNNLKNKVKELMINLTRNVLSLNLSSPVFSS